MTALLEWKQNLCAFCSKNEVYLLPVVKFLIAAAAFWLVDKNLGYMERLSSAPMLFILALVCALLPQAAVLFITAVLILVHCVALSLAAGAVAFVLFAVMYLLYFRFAPQYGYNALLMPMAYMLGIPYAVPAASGLLQKPNGAIPTICGAVTYYFLKGLVENAASLSKADGTKELVSALQSVINQFIGNREMYLSCAVFAFATIAVFIIRSLPVDYSWTIAALTGVLTQFLAFFIGYVELGMDSRNELLAFGCIGSALVLFIIQFFAFHLDYSRTERVQFEDDEYYYYVKAVPKQYVPARKQTVKTIRANKKKRK